MNSNYALDLLSCRAKIQTSSDIHQIDAEIARIHLIQRAETHLDIKAEALAIKTLKVASEKKEILTNRLSLYGRVQLPKTSRPFLVILKELSLTDPSLCEGFSQFESILEHILKPGSTNHSLTKEEVSNLKKFLTNVKEKFGIEHELYLSVHSLYKKIEETRDRKLSLLEDISFSFDLDLPFEQWNATQRIKLLVQAEQILRNPFEPIFELTDLLSSSRVDPRLSKLILELDTHKTVTSSKKDFWDNFSELERKANKLAAATDNGLEHLRNSKTEGLQTIAKYNNTLSSETHLIVGGGPAGLIHAISLALQNKSFEIIEKRPETKTARQNTVTFGKWEPKELKILMFLGTLAHLQERISFGHNRPYYTETALGDLEWALSETLKPLCNNQTIPIHYETEIESIDPNHITLRHTKKETSSTVKPDFVIVTDGAKGSTKKLLGIGQTALSQPTKIAFSIYQNDPDIEPTWWNIIAYRVVNAVKGIFLVLYVLFYTLITWETLEKGAAQHMDDGPCGLSRIPHHDYLLRIFRSYEQNLLEEYENLITVLQEQINTSEGDEKKHLQSLQQEAKEALQNRLETKSKKLHGALDFAHTLFNPKGHQMKQLPMKHMKTSLVEVNVGKAEQSTTKVGQTTFLIRGDASHITDPFSGTGAKTAIEETIVDHFFFNQNPATRNIEMEHAILEWGFAAYQNQMLNKAFEERLDYYLGTELPERFADCALQQGQISSQEHDLYLQLTARSQANELFSEEEKLDGALLKYKLIHLFQSELSQSPPAKETKYLRTVIDSILEENTVSDPSLPPLLAKLTCAGDAKGWLLQMILHLQAF